MHKERFPIEIKDTWKRRHLLGIQGMTAAEILTILEHAQSFKEVLSRRIKKVPTLRGRTIINLFLEPSTRTRTSFEIAGKRLSGDVINVNTAGSSFSKGETLFDTARNLQAMSPDVLVVRHHASGAPHLMAQFLKNCAIVNAGDGAHEHPTQALLDVMTIQEHKKKIAGLKVVIVGDILHSRVARSDIYALLALGAEVHVCAPGSMLPTDVNEMGVHVHYRIEDAVKDADVIMLLRIQFERKSGVLIPSTREYSRHFGLNGARFKLAKKDAIIMHPGPINRGVEIAHELADGPASVILDQVENGVAIRMAVLYLVSSVFSDSIEEEEEVE